MNSFDEEFERWSRISYIESDYVEKKLNAEIRLCVHKCHALFLILHKL